MSQPLVSVVMNTHNYGKFIKEAIDSILNQTYSNFELIIIDDASTDNTLEIINAYQDERIALITRSECTCSGNYARNDGFEIAQGSLIAISDADDVNVPTRLSLQVNYLQNHKSIDLLGGAFIQSDENLKPIARPQIQPRFKHQTQYRHALLKGRCMITNGTMMFRKHVLEKLHGYHNYMSSADYEFQIRASRYYNFYNLKDVLIYRRKHPNSVTRTYGQKLREYHHHLFLAREYEWTQKMIAQAQLATAQKTK